MDNKTNRKISKAGRKPVYNEERARIGFRCSLSLHNDLNELLKLYKDKGILIKGKEATINDYIVSVLEEKVEIDLYKIKKSK